jgi:hypothetical protein
MHIIIGTMIGIVVVGFTLIGFWDVVSIIVTGREYDSNPSDVPPSPLRRIIVTVWATICLVVMALAYLSDAEIPDSPLLVICCAGPLLFIFVVSLPYSLGRFSSMMSEFRS